MEKNSAPSDKDKGSIRPVNRRGQTPKRTETAIRPSKSRNLAGPSTENSFQSTRRLRGYKNLVKTINLQFKCALFILIIRIILADEIRVIRRPR